MRRSKDLNNLHPYSRIAVTSGHPPVLFQFAGLVETHELLVQLFHIQLPESELQEAQQTTQTWWDNNSKIHEYMNLLYIECISKSLTPSVIQCTI